MMVKIYLRALEQGHKNRLAMFDTNRNGDIDNLTTVVPRGENVFWKLDRCSGIKSITKIYSKNKERKVFKSDPTKLLLCKGFKFNTSESELETEAYTIEYILSDETKVVIDPYIRIVPPDTKT
jgi:hypothetical protein